MLEDLKEQLDYNPDTGVFTWKVHKNGAGGDRFGQVAGCVEHDGGRVIVLNQKAYRAHRLAWFYVNGKWPEGQILSIDGDRDNTAINNLREVPNGYHRRKMKE